MKFTVQIDDLEIRSGETEEQAVKRAIVEQRLVLSEVPESDDSKDGSSDEQD